MRLRRLDANGDMTFGRAQADFWIDQPEGVGQLIMTRLRLNWGEWFANMADGTPWAAQVLGERTQGTRDAVVRSRVFTTQGVQNLAGYNSQMDPNTRNWTAAMNVQTIYGPVQVALAALPGTLPPGGVLPAGIARLLGITGGPPPHTGLAMTPADLEIGGARYVQDFRITQIDPGAYR
jgi:hypothetical protein